MLPNGDTFATRKEIGQFISTFSMVENFRDNISDAAQLGTIIKDIRRAIRGCLWFEEPIATLTRCNYGRAYPWPICEYLLWKRRRELSREVFSKDGEAVDLSQLKGAALESLRRLSDLLGGDLFFSRSSQFANAFIMLSYANAV